MTLKKYFALTIMLIAMLSSAACGGSTDPVSPASDDQPVAMNDNGREIVAVYDAVVDIDAGTLEVTPANRVGSYHFPLTSLYPNVLRIVSFGFTPNLWANIQLSHPFPGSGIMGYDPRVIAIVPAPAMYSFNFPTMLVNGNNSIVTTPTGYTKMFDNLGPGITGNTNPYVSYFTAEPYAVWADTGVTSETQMWNMNIAGFDGSFNFKLVVDVSTNFPNPPTPVVDNAQEPRMSEAFVGDTMTSLGGEAVVNVILHDWQGPNNILVTVESPNLFNGTRNIPYLSPGLDQNLFVFEGMIGNELSCPAGFCPVLIAMTDTVTGLTNYWVTQAQVQD